MRQQGRYLWVGIRLLRVDKPEGHAVRGAQHTKTRRHLHAKTEPRKATAKGSRSRDLGGGTDLDPIEGKQSRGGIADETPEALRSSNQPELGCLPRELRLSLWSPSSLSSYAGR